MPTGPRGFAIILAVWYALALAALFILALLLRAA